jgi:hypothetical protein
MLDPSLDDLAALGERWSRSPNLRVAPFLAPGRAEEALEALRREPFKLAVPSNPTVDFQYWKHEWVPEPACEHVLCRLGRFLHDEWPAWVSRLTGLRLGPPPPRLLAASLYTKGSFLDVHNDFGRERSVAYVIGLTPPPWTDPGGSLEFVDGREGRVVLERRAPGWNTLDLFDVREPVRWHRVPIVREHAARWAISGWLYPRE